MDDRERERAGPDLPDGPALPEALRHRLRAVFGPHVPVPARVDRAIRAAARRQLQPRRFWIGRVAAAAAAVLVLALGALWLGPGAAPAGDFDGNGRVDILDAYRLCLRLEAREPVHHRWDQDGDGRVDRRDAERIARRAVAIDGRAR